MSWGYVFVAIAICATSASQIVQVLAARRLDTQASLIVTLKHPLVLLAYGLLGFGLVAWLLALMRLDISRTYPLFALGFVAVMLVARYGFKEQVGLRAWFGATLIVLGGVLCSWG
jgi:drug/metabolite transporter (DMT)-like permease